MMQGQTTDTLVSICLPTYNYERYLPQAIASCLRQSYEHVEVIIADDASTDNSVEIVRSYDHLRIRLVENPVRLGLVENWNKTLSLVRGQIIKFLFADDYLAMDAIERIVNAFDNPGVDLVFTAARAIDAEGHEIGIHQPYPDDSYLQGVDQIKSCLKGGNLIGGPSSVAVRTRAVEQAGMFDETLRFQADLEMWLRILLKGNAYYLAEPLVAVRRHQRSETSRLERTGQVQKETQKFLLRCVRNEQIRALLTQSEISELIGQYENASISAFLTSVRHRSYWEACMILAASAGNSRTVPYCSKLIRRVFFHMRRILRHVQL